MSKLNRLYARKKLAQEVEDICGAPILAINPQPISIFPLSVLLASLLLPQALYAEETQPVAKQNGASKKQAVADNNKEQTLPEVSVNAGVDLPKDGYQATKTRVGKVLQDPQDVPQAITTVTNSLMRDQQVGTLKEALRNVSGLTFNAAEGGRSGDNFMLRGFYTFGDIYLDGIRDTAQYNRETFNLEQVDVLRGSAAMLFGRGQAGGVINQVSKMAELGDENVVSGSLGNYGYHQETGDFNKQLSDTMAIRLNVMDRKEETYRTNPSNGVHPELDRQGIALSFGAGIGTDNEFFLNHVYTKTRDIPDYGISFVNARPISTATINDKTFYGSAKNFDNSDTNITTAIFTHKFDQDSEWRTQLRSAQYERSYWAKTPNANALPTDNGAIGGNVTRTSDYKTVALQSDYSNKFELAGLKHQFLGGAEYLNENSKRSGLQAFNPLTGQAYSSTLTTAQLNALIAANGVVYNDGVASFTGAQLNQFTADNYAVYAQDTITFAQKWDLLLGIRRDEMRANYSSSTSPKLNYGENSYRTGISYHPTEADHYYVSYSDAFSPTADLYQISGPGLPAERGKTTEAGSKWLLMDGNLAFRTAIYHTEKEWERNTDLESTAALLSRKRHTDGLELEMTGKVTDKLEVFAGLALMKARVDDQYDGISTGTFASITNNGTATGPAGAGTGYAQGEAADAGQTVYSNRSVQTSEGKRPRNTPDATLNIWTTYKFSPGWKAGLGLEAKAERFGYGVGTCGTTTQSTTPGATFGKWTYNNCSTAAFNPNTLAGYMRLDAMVTYEAKAWSVRLNVKNLLDKTYYDSLYDNGAFSVPGNGRQAILTTEYRF